MRKSRPNSGLPKASANLLSMSKNYARENMDQSKIATFLDSRSEAIRTKDIDQLMSHYSPDIIYFDLVPPLQYVGSGALRDRFSEWFDGYKAIRQEIHDLNISISRDIAFTSMLIQAGGTLKNGHKVELWVRATSCCQQSNDTWLITHEHISLPVDFKSGRAVMDLVPNYKFLATPN